MATGSRGIPQNKSAVAGRHADRGGIVETVDTPAPAQVSAVAGLLLGTDATAMPATGRPPFAAILRRNSESAKLLTHMATPKAFDGPDVQLRDQIVAKLDAQLENLPLLKSKAVVYLGSVVLENLPVGEVDFPEWSGSRDTKETDSSIPPSFSAVAATKAAGVGKELASHTLKVMDAAGQLDYLRKSGFVGEEWSIVVEMHYYRDRPRDNPNMHKDTIGQTLFVNLDYINTEPDAGPEYIVNPPPIAAHEHKIAQTLPDEFLKDLKKARKTLDPASAIDFVELQPNQVVAFVDELIHHSTPLVEHREIKDKELKEFLKQDVDFSDLYPAAVGLDEKRTTEGLDADFFTTFKLRTQATDEAARRWEALLTLCAKGKGIRRPDLVGAGMTDEQVDRLLAGHGSVFRTVHIDTRALTDKQTKIPLTETGSQDPITLKRRMSYLGQMPGISKDSEKKRAFLRTWVRAVKADNLVVKDL
jgi:hypothetical protein